MGTRTITGSLDKNKGQRPIAFFLPDLSGGGAEISVIKLAGELAHRGHLVDVIVANCQGPRKSDLDTRVNLVDLEGRGVLATLIPMFRYLKRNRPVALFSNLTHANVVSCLVKIFSSAIARTDTKVFVVECSILSQAMRSASLKGRFVAHMARLLFPFADGVITKSNTAARDLERLLGWPDGRVRMIRNPIVDDTLYKRSEVDPKDPWLQDEKTPCFLAAGRLHATKDYPTMLKAFKQVLQQQPARLLILGEGPERLQIEACIKRLQLGDHVRLNGYTSNPYAYLRRADALVLSSRFEGLANVVPEALALGCPVVATDSGGPRESLDGGKFGAIVPVGDEHALARAMRETLHHRPNPEFLRTRGEAFRVDRAADEYLSMILDSQPASSET